MTLGRTILRSIPRTVMLQALLLAIVVPALPQPDGAVNVEGTRRVGCVAPSGLVFVRADAPVPPDGGNKITFTGYVETPRDYCGDEARILAQRKVCGTFGCNYHTVERSPYIDVGLSAEFKLFADCKPGTHRYRTVVNYTAPNVRSPEKRFFVQDRQESQLITC